MAQMNQMDNANEEMQTNAIEDSLGDFVITTPGVVSTTDASVDNEDYEYCLISVPADVSLERLHNVSINRIGTQTVHLQSKSYKVHVSNDESCILKERNIVLMPHHHSTTNEEQEMLVSFPRNIMQITKNLDLSECGNNKNFIPRPEPPLLPPVLKNRTQLFGWKHPPKKINKKVCEINSSSPKKHKKKHKKRKHEEINISQLSISENSSQEQQTVSDIKNEIIKKVKKSRK